MNGLPRLQLERLYETAEVIAKKFTRDENKSHSSMPLVPPKLTETVNVVLKSAEAPSWYVVLSPRETRGISGPLSVAQLKQMYKVGEITDGTLVWQEGESNWQQLVHHSFLRSQLIYLPVLPPRVGSYNAELALFDPIIDIPCQVAEQVVPLEEVSATKACQQCGNIATMNCLGVGEQMPDLFKCRNEVGTNEYASEILPGFLWVGSAQAVKYRSLTTLGFTLIINCTKNMKNPQPQPPQYRCKYCPLDESPSENFTEDDFEIIESHLEKCYDWIEIERLNPDKVAQSDPKVGEYRGPTDKMGKPLKSNRDKLQSEARQHLNELTIAEKSRVLIWSKNGIDRACFVAAAFLIKNFGITVEKALTIIKSNRPEMKLSSLYRSFLDKWEQKYVLGTLLCQDCVEDKRNQYYKELEKKAIKEENIDDSYELCVKNLHEHIPKLLQDQTISSKIENARDFLFRIPRGFDSSIWSGLLDLELPDRRLTDKTLGFLFQLLSGGDCMLNLRNINLRNNQFGKLAAKSLLLALFPKANADPDDGDYLVDKPRNPEAAEPALMCLDLSYNT
jgi:hypothetical protein